MLDGKKLLDLVYKCTVELRKGAEIEEETLKSGQKITYVYMMDHESSVSDEDYIKYDLVFIKVGVNKKEAPQYKKEFISLLEPALGQIHEGQSYITWGTFGISQDLALITIALGKFYDLWDIITPMSMGFSDAAKIRELAGMGLIYNSGFKDG